MFPCGILMLNVNIAGWFWWTPNHWYSSFKWSGRDQHNLGNILCRDRLLFLGYALQVDVVLVHWNSRGCVLHRWCRGMLSLLLFKFFVGFRLSEVTWIGFWSKFQCTSFSELSRDLHVYFVALSHLWLINLRMWTAMSELNNDSVFVPQGLQTCLVAILSWYVLRVLRLMRIYVWCMHRWMNACMMMYKKGASYPRNRARKRLIFFPLTFWDWVHCSRTPSNQWRKLMEGSLKAPGKYD